MARKLVRDIMTKGVVSVPEGVTIREAIRKMAEEEVSSLTVLRGGDKPYGIVTRGDIIRSVFGQDGSIDAPVEDIMTVPLILATPNLRIKDAAQLMQRYGIRRLPVLQRGEIVGIISSSDIFNYLIRRAR
jgi:CBS domain-containing protein